jgi:uncharacterized protein
MIFRMGGMPMLKKITKLLSRNLNLLRNREMLQPNSSLDGWGVPQDYKEAIKWYKLSAEQENTEAQFNLGNMYLIIQDYVQAHKWFNIAGANGVDSGRENRNITEERMTPKDIFEAQKLAREWMEKHK